MTNGHNDMRADLSSRFPKYHLGCGPLMIDGFLNIDGSFDRISKEVASATPFHTAERPLATLFKYDLRLGIPAVQDSLELIYHSHFLEHLTDIEGQQLLRDCYRCLRPGAVMRLAVPDFRLWCSNYMQGNRDFFSWYKRSYLGGPADRYVTNASVFMGMLYNWGHKCIYDRETLELALTKAGFSSVSVVGWGESHRIENIGTIEGDSQRKLESIVVEAVKS
jgi:predicted SAM-dependent methyltransferase